MADLLNIPVDSAYSSFKERVELDDKEFVLKFDWNTRLERWFVSLLDGSENPLVMGITLVANYPLFNRFKGSAMPQGVMMLYDATGRNFECGREDLGATHLLIYQAAE
jgi:hypothetical protein